jgi:integrase
MTKNPALSVKQVKDESPGALPFEAAEIDAIIRACDSIDKSERNRLRARALVLLLLYSGFRISDAAKFKRRSLNLETHRFLVRTLKTGEHVMFVLGSPAVEALLGMAVENEEYFFWSGEHESDLETCVKSLRRTLDAIRRKTGINVHPHRFRDTFAVRLLEHDVPIRTVSRLLGHKSVITTERYYAHWVKTHQKLLDQAVAVLDFVSPASNLDDPS